MSVPVYEHVPLFRELLDRHDVRPRAAVVYGVIAVYKRMGHEPSVQDVAGTCKDRSKGHVRTRRIVRDLEALGLVRRHHEAGKPVRFELLGPNYRSS